MKKSKEIKNSKKGLLIWITGFSGSGKTTLANEINNFIERKKGPTVVLSGDNLRKAFGYDKFDRKSRLKYAKSYSLLCKNITDKKINLIFATVSMFNSVRNWNKKNVDNYIEIYIESNIDKLIKKGDKFFYKKKQMNIVGKNIHAELPSNSDIKIKNDLQKPIQILKKELIAKLNKIFRS